MEFFDTVDIQTTEKQIQEQINFAQLENFCPNLFVLENESPAPRIGSIWGEFFLGRDEIKGGLRFSLLDCPNALAWTITTGYPPEREKIVLHFTINRTQKPAEFVEEIKDFIADWKEGLLESAALLQ